MAQQSEGKRGRRAKADAPEGSGITIKKYANRRLYNTATSSYVTLENLSEMVKAGTEFAVFDARTGEDITRSVLTQIIVEEEAKGENLLPIAFLRRLIGLYGSGMQTFVPGYLEMSLDALTKQQEQVGRALGGEAGAAAMRRMTEQNAELFRNAMRAFMPFAPGAATPGAATPGAAASAEPAPQGGASGSDELADLRAQVEAMKAKLDGMGDG